jgi:antitoxin (DNA-binding transcriptional repressor) of toxin-antitoxin stability system
MTVGAAEFKAHCLRLMEQVRRTRKPVLITKRGRVVAQLGPPPPEAAKPWTRLRGSVVRARDVLSPAVSAKDIRALR